MADVDNPQQLEAPAEQPHAQEVPYSPPASSEQADGDGEEAKPLSKSQQKKLRRLEMRRQRKQELKQIEKERKKEQQTQRREEGRQRLEGMTEEERAAHRAEKHARIDARRQEGQGRRAKLEQALATGQRIIIDLEFFAEMNPTEVKSLCQQLAYSYSAIGRAACPAHLMLTGLRGPMLEAVERQANGFGNWVVTRCAGSYMDMLADRTGDLVYLTADAPDELAELDPQKAYIIGGIVDRNRHKGICYKKAQDQGIAAARLPIGEYLRLASSQVMTTNHVVEIMLRWLELRDWRAAFEAVVPPRKRKHGELPGGGQLPGSGQQAGPAGPEGGDTAEAAVPPS